MSDVHSTIKINVDDAEFKNFSALFEKYKAALGQMPDGWKAVGNEIGKTGTTFEIVLAAMLMQHELTKSIAQAEAETAATAEKKNKDNERATSAAVRGWKDLSRFTRDVAGNIVRATESLLKWTAITSVVGGLLGAGGGLFGIDRMAASVAAGRKSSQGIGATYGGQKAFGIAYGQVVDDPDSFLGNVNQALQSTNKQVLFGARMNPEDLKGDTSQVGERLLLHMKQVMDTWPKGPDGKPAFLVDQMHAFGFDQVISQGTANRLLDMTPKEAQSYASQFAYQHGHLNVADDTQSAWVDFKQQMQTAGDELENIFIKGLVKLEPSLKSLSVSFTHLAETIANSPVIKHWIDDIAVDLEKLSKYIGSKKFEQDVDDFTRYIGEMAAGLGKLKKVASWMFGGVVDVAESAAYGYHTYMGDNAIAVPTREGAFGHTNTMRDWFSGTGAFKDDRSWIFHQGANDPFMKALEAEEFQPEGASAARLLTSGFETGTDSNVAAYARGNSPSISAGVNDFTSNLKNATPVGDISRILSRMFASSVTKIDINNPSGASVTTSTSMVGVPH